MKELEAKIYKNLHRRIHPIFGFSRVDEKMLIVELVDCRAVIHREVIYTKINETEVCPSVDSSEYTATVLKRGKLVAHKEATTSQDEIITFLKEHLVL